MSKAMCSCFGGTMAFFLPDARSVATSYRACYYKIQYLLLQDTMPVTTRYLSV